MTDQSFNDRLLHMQSRMLNFAMILTSDRDEAYSLLQETTLQALDRADDYEEGTSFPRWAINVMRSIYVSRYRHAAPPPIPVRVAFGIVEDIAEVPEGSFAADALSARVGSLSEPMRRIVSMWIVGYTAAEISSSLRLDSRTVMRHLRAFRP